MKSPGRFFVGFLATRRAQDEQLREEIAFEAPAEPVALSCQHPATIAVCRISFAGSIFSSSATTAAGAATWTGAR
jgi:hypothetical protein